MTRLFPLHDHYADRTEPFAVATGNHSCGNYAQVSLVQVHDMPALRALVETFPFLPIVLVSRLIDHATRSNFQQSSRHRPRSYGGIFRASMPKPAAGGRDRCSHEMSECYLRSECRTDHHLSQWSVGCSHCRLDSELASVCSCANRKAGFAVLVFVRTVRQDHDDCGNNLWVASRCGSSFCPFHDHGTGAKENSCTITGVISLSISGGGCGGSLRHYEATMIRIELQCSGVP